MDIGKIGALITHFFAATNDWEWLHIKIQSKHGKRELFIPNGFSPDNLSETPAEQTVQPTEDASPPPQAQETLDQKVERIRSIIAGETQLEGDDLEWWKNIQAQLGGNQIVMGDTHQTAIEKLASIGITQ